MAFGFTNPYAMLQSPTAMSPGNVQQMAAMGNAMQAMPAGNPMQAAMQSMAPAVPTYQGANLGGGPAPVTFPPLASLPPNASGTPAPGSSGGLMNPQLMALLKKYLSGASGSTGTVSPGTVSMGYSNPFASPASSAGGPPLAY